MGMKWRSGLPVIVVSILAVILLKNHFAGDVQPPDERTSRAAAPADTSSSTNPTATGNSDQHHYLAEPATFVPITGGKPRPRAPMDPFFRIPKTRNGLPLEGDYFVAESVQEQRWLDRNGYPNAEQWAAYSAAPDMTLAQAAAHGDDVADIMLAARQLAHGDPKAGGKLMTAGMNGSSFALSMLASYLANGKYGNPELGYAVSRVVELRGDWRSGMTRDYMFRTPLTPQQKARGESEAIKLIDSFRSRSPVQPYVDPRPLHPQTKG
jgi:hypothetical protein